MAGSDFDRAFTRAGFSLILLALVTGFGIPNFLNPRMAVAAHLSGVLNGLLLIALSSVWSRLALSPGQLGLAKGVSLFAAYGNWATSCLAAAWGTSRMTPLAGAGHAAVPWKESVVQVTQVSRFLRIASPWGWSYTGFAARPLRPKSKSRGAQSYFSPENPGQTPKSLHQMVQCPQLHCLSPGVQSIPFFLLFFSH